LPALQVVDPQMHAPLEVLHMPPPPASQSSFWSQRQSDVRHLNSGGQAWPQAPQLAASFVGLMQPAGVWQQIWLLGHLAPPLQEQRSFGPVFLQTSPGTQTVWPHLQVSLAGSQVPPDEPVLQTASLLQPHRFGPAAPHVSAPQLLPQPPHDMLLLCASSSQPSSALGAIGFWQLALPRTHDEVH
jgi:hypothetical protein